MTLQERIDELKRILDLKQGDATAAQTAPELVQVALDEFETQRLANTRSILTFESDWEFNRASSATGDIKRGTDLLMQMFALLRQIAAKHLQKSFPLAKKAENPYLKDHVDRLKSMMGQILKATSVASFYSVLDWMPGVGRVALAEFANRVGGAAGRLKFKAAWDFVLVEHEMALLQLSATMMSQGFQYLNQVDRHKKEGGGCFPI